ncbi:hypothetical protein [Staphylococcus ureilyticus]|uniref:hypothetical protein n=1 Tax=Staphylococcus ureilyticus TaxID=94138 RepID=UPI00227B38FC|nr:hypothetical protein [Staphylococcus ureilyticus]
MKIKTKIQLKLPQLIEWGFKNDIKNKSYKTNDTEGYELYFDEYGTPRFSNIVNKNDTFTVEVEEEITEDTKISILAHYSIYGFKRTKNCTSINDVKDDNSIAFYIMNHDRTMTLIWTKETGLVE